MRELLVGQLTEVGYEVVAADSAETAVAILEDGVELDVVVSDHAMTGMSGVALIRQGKRKKICQSYCLPATSLTIRTFCGGWVSFGYYESQPQFLS